MIKDRIEFIQWMKESINPTKIVEVGVFRGGYAQHINLVLPNAELHLVDLWEKVGNIPWMFKTEEEARDMYNRVQAKFTGIPGVHMHKMSSQEASRLFLSDSLDWVYIDANHTYEAVSEDIDLWLPKVRPGGVISGHDYSPNPRNSNVHAYGVNRAVNEAFGEIIGLTGESFYKTWYTIKQ